MGGHYLHVCCDCLCVIALFRDVMLLIHDWAALSTWIGPGIGYGRTYTWEVGYLGSIYPPWDVDVIRFLRCACERVTSVGVVFPGMLLILVIGLLDCVGGPSGRYDWLDRLSWGGGGG